MKALIQITDISKRYGVRALFENASVTLLEGQKAGVIGRNGAGKSTLLKILMGEETPDEGRVRLDSDLRLSYLEQHESFKENERVVEFLMRHTGKEAWECGKIAARFGVTNEKFEGRAEDLSSGYRMRVKLAAMLLKEPNFLLLDEPSNYLDLRTLIMLEKFLQDYKGGFLVVSHDREFLKRTCEHTLEIENAKMTLYPGDIEAYLAFKEEQMEYAKNYNKNVSQKQKNLERFIERFGAKASKAKQAQSKQKQLHRLKKIEIAHALKTVSIVIPQVEAKKGFAVYANNLSIGYREKTVATDVRFEVTRGARIAVLGDNGEGKSTLLKTMHGELPPLNGAFRYAKDISVALYAEHVVDAMRLDQSVMAYLQTVCPETALKETILRMAGNFLFKDDDLDKPLRVLSGGERSRLCLAGILLSKRDVLLLDEPTNHLDFETVEALARALTTFAGTVFFISHDRTFVHMVATGIMEIRKGRLELYNDTYDNYVWRLERMNDTDGDVLDAIKEPVKARGAKDERKEKNLLLGKLAREIQAIEDALETLEAEKRALLASFETSPQYDREKTQRLGEVNDAIKEQERLWLEKHETLEAAKGSARLTNTDSRIQ